MRTQELPFATVFGSSRRHFSRQVDALLEDLRVESGENAIETLNGNTSAVDKTVTVCVVCCSTASMPTDIIDNISHAFSPVATVQSAVLSDSAEKLPGVDVVQVPQGTKLSKIRRFVDLVDADLVCICDPDLRINESSCRMVLERAVAERRCGNDVVAFGLVDGYDNGTVLSRVLALDKWLSHRVLRPFLWDSGIGITLPGQFLVVSTRLLHGLDPKVDSYLDDLYLGWIVRKQRARVHRLSVIVGEEDPRTTWNSLLAQRLRWMRGFVWLVGHLAVHPSAIALLAIHYLAYHGLPMLILLSIAILSGITPIGALATFLLLVLLLARLSRQSVWIAATFLAVFPVVHCLATLLWWIPVRNSYFVKR